ncbi:ABC transporter ATP-binding protein [Helicobacter aurati]|uniref:ABC transporter ATP-binding protein n=1 Tax=Helicobacter aurati TaxID=137778 RepID=A0A3D8IYH1_9HELI|nr:dipeptide/oligopeptide/nickel ABC transporter ATP-binding protein [Helicobacter aurati]RDU70312.1 ABC transporter ATP-binding protein [Helicobacter aurati]
MLLTLQNICYDYQSIRFFSKAKGLRILSNINLQIDIGECVGIMGANGCGKSTLARIIAGLQRQTSGKIFLHDVLVKPQSLSGLLRRAQQEAFYKQVQIIFQDPISSLNPRFTILQNLQEPLHYLLDVHKKEAQLARIVPLMESLELDSAILQSYPAMVSGGQAQRICLIRALLVKPSLLILDEATSNLDYILCIKILRFLKDWQNNNACAFLYITHNEEFALNFCQRLLMMGEIKGQGNGIINERFV